jgi:ankyrin repeat protein
MLGYIISEKNYINVEEYEIKSFDVLHKTDLNIFVIENNKVLYKNYIIHNACKNGHIQVLEWFKNSGYDFYDECGFEEACINGHIQVLEWFKNYDYEFKYDIWAINYASENGYIEVLEWFKNSGFEFKFSEYAINNAAGNGYIDILEWFKNSGYEFKYDEDAIHYASNNGHIQVLEWFKNSGFKLKYSKYVFKIQSIKILKIFSYCVNIKKLIKWSNKIMFIKTIKFKTKNKYLKGYQKN